jgi:uncharacterized membrane protein
MLRGLVIVIFVYAVAAWIGVMLVGFGVSPIFERPAHERSGILLRGGAALTIAFVVLRAIDIYGDPKGWQVDSARAMRTALDFLNTTKYPPSLDFLLMTLGPRGDRLLRCRRSHRWNQGRAGHVRAGTIRVLRGAL